MLDLKSANLFAPELLAPQPLSHARALAARYFTDPRMPELDACAVFAKSWQLLGHNAQLADIGDHFVTDIAGLSIVVIRDIAGQIRAYHNVCRHRAGPLALCAGKGAKGMDYFQKYSRN